jgi:hypothetical protein
MSRRIKGIKKYLSICFGIDKNISVSVCASKGEFTKTIDQD